jgi:hypothetical protein
LSGAAWTSIPSFDGIAWNGDVRYNIKHRNRKESQDEKDELLLTSKNIYYPKRSFEYVINKSNIDENKKNNLKKYLETNKFDIKHDDAKAVIEYIKKLAEE